MTTRPNTALYPVRCPAIRSRPLRFPPGGDSPRGELRHFLPAFLVGEGRFHFPYESLAFCERRIDAYQVHRFVVQPTEKVQIIGDEQMPI